MDELSALPPESTSKAIHRLRTSSLNQRRAFASHSPSTARTASPLRHFPPRSNHADRPEIIAPVPRRHLLDTFTDQPWMRPSSPLSPTTLSPPAAFHRHPTAPPSTSPTRSRRLSVSSTLSQRQSFSTLHGTGNTPTPASPSALASPSRKLRKVSNKTDVQSSSEKAMGRRWIRWMHKRGIEDWVVPCAVLTSVLIKWCICLGPYSG